MSSFSARSRASNQSIQQETTDQRIGGDNGELVNRHGVHDMTADRGASRHCRLIAVRKMLGVLCVLFRCKAARCVLRRTARDDEPLRGTRRSTTVPSSTPTPAIGMLRRAFTRQASERRADATGAMSRYASWDLPSQLHPMLRPLLLTLSSLCCLRRCAHRSRRRIGRERVRCICQRTDRGERSPTLTRRRSVRFFSAFSASSFDSELLFSLTAAASDRRPVRRSAPDLECSTRAVTTCLPRFGPRLLHRR
jgi:hypothetical protein